jgi:hypothetical protein
MATNQDAGNMGMVIVSEESSDGTKERERLVAHNGQEATVMYHKGAIESYPFRTHASALLYSPTGSMIRQLFQHEDLEESRLEQI